MAAAVNNQTKIEKYFSPPPTSSQLIKPNSLVQNKKRRCNGYHKKSSGYKSPRITSINNQDMCYKSPPASSKSIKSNLKHKNYINKNRNKNRNKNKNKNRKNWFNNYYINAQYTHLIAFDFDQTLSSQQVFNNSLSSSIYLFGGVYRVELINKFLSYLRTESSANGYKYRIIIISYNYSSVIKLRLKELKLFHYFDCIYDRYFVNKNGGYKKGKGNLIKKLSNKWNINFNTNTLIIDDCRHVIWNSYCQTIHVKNYNGMDKYEMEQICKIFKLKIPDFLQINCI